MADETIPRLTTARLLLREWRDVDRVPFAELNADARVAEFLSRPLDRAASDAFVDRIVARWASDGHGLWAVERREDGAFLGFVGLAAPSFEAAFTPCVDLSGQEWARLAILVRATDQATPGTPARPPEIVDSAVSRSDGPSGGPSDGWTAEHLTGRSSPLSLGPSAGPSSGRPEWSRAIR